MLTKRLLKYWIFNTNYREFSTNYHEFIRGNSYVPNEVILRRDTSGSRSSTKAITTFGKISGDSCQNQLFNILTNNIVKIRGTYQFRRFTDLGVVAAFSNREFNLGFSNNSLSTLKYERYNFLKNLDINYKDLVCAKQAHKTKVSYIDEKDKGRGALNYNEAISNTDALITNKINLPLAIFTADCLSIFLYDAKNKAIGLVHSGWRSTKGNIVRNALNLMQRKFNTHPQDLLVAFGPAIRSCCYEVRR